MGRPVKSSVNLPTLKGYHWLIDRRVRVLWLLLDILTPMKQQRAPIKKDWDRYSLFVGSAFSLWRAVFLAKNKEYAGTGYENAKIFIDEVLKTQIINFPQDKAALGWTCGYYLNNSIFRLAILAQLMHRARHESVDYVKRYSARNISKEKPTRVFDKCLKANLILLKFYLKQGSKRYM